MMIKLDHRDIMRQIRATYTRGNILLRKYRKCTDEVKLQLFNSYCTNLYCSQLWCSYSSSVLNRVKVAYNNIFRYLLKIRGPCSMSHIYMELNVDAFKVLIRKAITKFYQRLQCSENSIISVLVNSTFFLMSSQMFKTWSSLIF
jgi:hypothetical protein